jgi:4-hydroxybenzoate polyprenyltransferase
MSIGGSAGTSNSTVRRLAGEFWRLGKRSRPRFWLYLAGPAVVGIAYGANSVGELTSPLSVALVGYFLIPANVYLYGVNDIFDAEIDRRNPKKDDREVRYDGDRLTVPAVLLCGLGAIAITAGVPAPARPWVGAFLVLATAYSAPPVRLKVRPLLDSLSNGLYVLPGAGAYAALSGTAPPVAVLLGAWLWTMAMHTFSAIPDIEPDRRGGIQTTATVLGHRRALAYCFVCWLGAAVAMAVIDIRLGALFGLYPVLLAAMAASDIHIDRAYWWFPYVNTLVGMVFTLGGLWVIVHG